MDTRLLIIDSDLSLATVLCDYLASRGYNARMSTTAQDALQLISDAHWDGVLTELQVAGINGFDLLREIRHRQPLMPLIVLTTRSDRESQLRAFQLGADDYVIKPFSMDILICRIEAIMRRVHRQEENRQRRFDLSGHLFDATLLTLDGKHLSGRESDLLLMLCRNMGETVDRHAILASLWREDNAFTSRSLGVFINHLRNILQPTGYTIIAIRRRGYRLINQKTDY